MITKPEQAVAFQRRSRLADALPLIVLGAGLLVVLIVVSQVKASADLRGTARRA